MTNNPRKCKGKSLCSCQCHGATVWLFRGDGYNVSTVKHRRKRQWANVRDSSQITGRKHCNKLKAKALTNPNPTIMFSLPFKRCFLWSRWSRTVFAPLFQKGSEGLSHTCIWIYKCTLITTLTHSLVLWCFLAVVVLRLRFGLFQFRGWIGNLSDKLLLLSNKPNDLNCSGFQCGVKLNCWQSWA